MALIDAHGPANSRASSGGESRIIRMAYGPDEIYSRWALRSLDLWTNALAAAEPPIFHRTGVLWMAQGEDSYSLETVASLERLGIPHEKLSRPEMEKRYPQFAFGPVTWAILEPESGVLMARRAVQTLVLKTLGPACSYIQETVLPPAGKGRLDSVRTHAGGAIHAGTFIFACGPWLPKMFPDLLGARILVTRQEVFFFWHASGRSSICPTRHAGVG